MSTPTQTPEPAAPATPTVPALLEDLTKLATQFRHSVEYAQGLEAELTRSKADLAAAKAAAQKPAPPVTLQKVAFDENTIAKTLDVLVERELLAETDREKTASLLRENPDAGLRLCQQVAAINTNLPAAQTGVGIAKEADERKSGLSENEFAKVGSAREWLEM